MFSGSRITVGVLGVTLLSGGLIVGTTAAHADVYWTTMSTIGTADSDGDGANPKFIKKRAVAPDALAVSGNHLYWASSGNVKRGSIGRSRLDGTRANPAYLPGIRSPLGLAVSDSYLYWSHGSKISRAKLGKGAARNVSANFISGLPSGTTSLVVDSQHIYWIGSSTSGLATIGRANLDGSGVDSDFIAADANITGLAIDSDHLYWSRTDSKTTTIVRSDLAGGNITDLVTGLPKHLYMGIGVNSKYIYWTAPGLWSGLKSVMGRANLDGSSPVQQFLSGSQLVPGGSSWQTMLPGLAVTD